MSRSSWADRDEFETPTVWRRFRAEIGGETDSHVTHAPVRISRMFEPRGGRHARQHSTTAGSSNRVRSRRSPSPECAGCRELPTDRGGKALSRAAGEGKGNGAGRLQVQSNVG